MTLDTAKLKEELDGDHFRNHFFLFNSSFGESGSIDGSKHDIYAAAKKHKENGDALCKFYLCCGSEEFIRWRVEADVRLLRDLGYSVEYICAEGYNHDFRMWNDYIEIALDRLLPLKRAMILPGKDAPDAQ